MAWSSQKDLFIQDSTGGIYVNPEGTTVDFHPGQYVEIDGRSGLGDFASEVVNPKIQVLGDAPLPAPEMVSGDEFVTGVHDSQYVELEGIVRSAAEDQGRLLLHLGSGVADIPAFVLDYKPIPQDLVGATIHLQGVSGGVYNARNQFLGANLLVPSLKNLIVKVPAPADLFRCLCAPFTLSSGSLRPELSPSACMSRGLLL